MDDWQDDDETFAYESNGSENESDDYSYEQQRPHRTHTRRNTTQRRARRQHDRSANHSHSAQYPGGAPYGNQQPHPYGYQQPPPHGYQQPPPYYPPPAQGYYPYMMVPKTYEQIQAENSEQYGLISGIISVALLVLFPYIAFVPGILAIYFGRQARELDPSKGQAGIILGVITIIISLLILLLFAFVFSVMLGPGW